MSKKITHFGRICVTYVLVLTLVFSFVMSSFVGLNITASADTPSNPSNSGSWSGSKTLNLDELAFRGEGTEESPYWITNGDQLWYAVNNTDASKYFKVMNDIVINDTSNFESWTNDEDFVDWNPAGTDTTQYFAGNFNGNGKTISGLYASTSETNNYLGLFSRIGSNSVIYDVIVDKAYFNSTKEAMTFVGGIAGGSNKTPEASLIYGCVVKNSKIFNLPGEGDHAVGGIVGGLYTGSNTVNITIENCAAVDIEFSSSTWRAGIVGANWGTNTHITLKNCFTTGYSVAHKNQGITITGCYTTTDVLKPFDQETNQAFGNKTGIYQVAKENMKGLTALDDGNMDQLDPTKWTLSANYYPMPKPQKSSSFLESDKVADLSIFKNAGTATDPYRITNAIELWAAVNNTDASKFFKVMNDIVVNDTSNFENWTDNEQFADWNPAGTDKTQYFAGNFNGNGKTISGLYASTSETNNYLGLFSRIGSNSIIYDVIVDKAYFNSTTEGMTFVGGIAGGSNKTPEASLIYGCVVKNSKIFNRTDGGDNAVGGIVGGLYTSSNTVNITIENCAAVDNELSNSKWRAGIIGANWGANTHITLNNCFTTGYSVAHRTEGISVTGCYTTTDATKPYDQEPNQEFGDTTNIYQVEKENMKGLTALDAGNMELLDPSEWTAVPDDYPMPKSYAAVSSDFSATDKNLNDTIFEETGAIDDPYQITNAAELWKAVHNTDATKYFKVMNDIVINDTSAFNEWDDSASFEDWDPNATFVGTFNGNQKVISGLYASSSTSKYLGLFSRVGNDALIYDVIIDSAYFSLSTEGQTATGGLIGTAHNATNVFVYGCIVKNSKITGTAGEAGEAGLIGAAWSSSEGKTITLRNCYAVDNVLSGRSVWSSGLMAARWNTEATMINCFTTDAPLEHQRLGAITTNCYVSGDVEYPFTMEIDPGVFGEAGVYKINIIDMMGESALENMSLSSSAWTTTESYPMPKPYVLEKDAWAGEKAVTSFVQLDGDGTKDSPYLITNGDELWFVVNNTAKIGASGDQIPYFRLENDIKLNAVANYSDWATEAPANAWLPSGAFVGHFDGNYKTITGLYATPSTEASAGLFAAVESSSSVKNLTLNQSYIKATAGSTKTVVGGIVGIIDSEANVELAGLTVKNTILEGRGLTGGIVGLITNSTGAVVVERAASIDNTITVIDLMDGTSAAAGLVGDAVNNAANTAVIAHSFTTSNYISRQSNGAIYNNVYTTDDMAKPFAAEESDFNDSVKAIALADMKGENAVTNMGLDEGYWNVVADSYPVVKPYADPNNFSAEDKTLTIADLNGSGTKDDPYKITNAAELWVAVNSTDPLLYFKVMNDIAVNNASEFAAWDDNSDMEDWNPTEKFSGNFDGNKKVISGLYVSSSADKYLGLFAQLGNGVRIIDVIVDKAYICYTNTTGQSHIGGLVGRAVNVNDVVIYGCVVKNSKILNRNTGGAGEGGLIGGAYSTSVVGDIEIANCYAVDNELYNQADWSSGLVAARWTTKISLTDCFTTDYPLEHQDSAITVKNCYVSGDVKYPFAIDPKGEFGQNGVYKIDNAAMKGADALTNMNFSTSNWKATDGYPESLIKFKDNDGKVGEVWSGGGARTFAGGDGTEANPWQIDTPERLYRMVNGYPNEEHWFIITADIKLNDTTATDWYTSDSAKPWLIGKKFIGHVDGQGYTVSGLYVNHNSSYTSGAGLIPNASGNATITNINLDNCYIVGNTAKESYTGALVGYVPSGLVRIAGCNVSNAVVGSVNRFGGILGAESTAVTTIDYCTFEGQKIATNNGTNFIGGIIGDSWATLTVTNSVSKGIAAIGKGSPPLSAVYSDVSQGDTGATKAEVIILASEDMIGSAAKTNMDKLKWNYFETHTDGMPTAKKIDLSTEATQGTPGEVWSGFASAGYAGGTGTASDPYLISTAEQLFRFNLEAKARFKNADAYTYVRITHDIYLNDVSDENWKEKDNLNIWLGAGTMGSGSFYGHVDGDYHVIYGMYSNHNTPGSSTGLVISANQGTTFRRLGISEGYIMNGDATESYVAAFVGYVGAKGTAGTTMADGEYIPIKFTECFVDDSFEITGYYAGGFIGGTPMGIDFEDCYSNVYVADTARYSGAFIGNAWDKRYPDSFRNCYAIPASKWTGFSEVSEVKDPATGKNGIRQDLVSNCYYFGSAIKYFPLLFYKDMYGEAAKTNMIGFNFDNIWKTVDGGSPVLRGFKNDDFASKNEVYTTVSLISGTEDINLPDMEGVVLSTLNLPVPEREGYFFGGWYVYEEGACEYDYGIFPVVDTTLYAKWNANSVTQNFENYVNTKYDYDDDYVYYRPGVSGYSSMKVHGGSKAMFRKGESAEEQDLILNATEPIAADEEYRISFWVAAEEADTKATISLVHYTWPDFQDPNLGVEKMVEIDSLEVGKWTSYTYKFKASTPWIGIRTSGNAKLYMDDFFITPVAESMKDASKVNDYDYFYAFGEADMNTTGQTLSGMVSTQVNTLAPTSAVSTEDTNNTIAFLVTVILAASALVVLSRVSIGDTKQEIENNIEE